MASRKAQPAQIPPLPDDLIWLAAALVAQLGVLISHDGQRMPATGAGHLAAEVADDLLIEFSRRFRPAAGAER